MFLGKTIGVRKKLLSQNRFCEANALKNKKYFRNTVKRSFFKGKYVFFRKNKKMLPFANAKRKLFEKH